MVVKGQYLLKMNNQLYYYATVAWAAFGAQDYSGLEQYGTNIYNYFVHNPEEILRLDNPLLIGKIFQVCLSFQDVDEDIQEVKAENAFLCFSQALKSDKLNVYDEASARLMMLLIVSQKYLMNKVETLCRNEYVNPFSIFSVLGDEGLPLDMPVAANTKMLFAAYYLYNGIKNKENVCNEFVNSNERRMFEYTENHVLENCSQLHRTPNDRKIELGGIVFDKICERLRKDIALYSDSM